MEASKLKSRRNGKTKDRINPADIPATVPAAVVSSAPAAVAAPSVIPPPSVLAAVGAATEQAETDGLLGIPGIAFRYCRIRVVGTGSGLLVHRFFKKMRDIMRWQKEHKKDSKRDDPTSDEKCPIRHPSPTECFESSKYRTPRKGWDGFPAGAFADAMITSIPSSKKYLACEFRRAFTIVAAIRDSEAAACNEGCGDGGLVYLEDPKDPDKPAVAVFNQKMCKIGPRRDVADERFRPIYAEWAATLLFHYNSARISAEMLVRLLESAGFSIGAGEWRREKGGCDFGGYAPDQNFGIVHVER